MLQRANMQSVVDSEKGNGEVYSADLEDGS